MTRIMRNKANWGTGWRREGTGQAAVRNKANSHDRAGASHVALAKQSQSGADREKAKCSSEKGLWEKTRLAPVAKTKPSCSAGQMVGTAHTTRIE
jgi:hypothetical protein